MADDSLEILEEHEFHPADPPQGMRNYDLGSLMPDQQRTLNEFKMIQRVENENYLKAHPEIKGLISILLSLDGGRQVPIVEIREIARKLFSKIIHKSTINNYFLALAPPGLRHILEKKPLSKLHETAGSFFTRPVSEIAAELRDYLVDNGYSSPVIDTLDKGIGKLKEDFSTDMEDGFAPGKSLANSSETLSVSLSDI